MDGVGAGFLDRRQQGVDDQIAFRRGRRTDADRFIGHRHMNRVDIGVGVDGHRLNAHGPRRAHDPASDFTAIGD